MPQTNIKQTVTSDLATAQSDWSVTAAQLDGPADQKETEYQIADWTTKYGYYRQIPELQAAIDAKATWTVGKGFEAPPEPELLLSVIVEVSR